MSLEEWGWDSYFNDKYKTIAGESLIPGRIVKESRHLYNIETRLGLFQGKVSGHYIYTAMDVAKYPTIGDWVAVRIDQNNAVIEKLLDRKSAFSRKRNGDTTQEQVIAANIDYIFLVFALDGGRNYSPGGVERFLTRAWDSGASPIIILNKCDLCKTIEDYLYQTELLAPGVPVHLTSAVTMEGLEELKQYLKPGKTVAFTGFSGVGKSALINSLCGVKLMKTGEIREQDLKGKHTTTHKQLIKLSNGGLLIDSPGLKELQLWGDEDTLNSSFSDIAELGESCRFRDCTHTGEPNCGVQKALNSGELDYRRFENYLDLKKELKYLETKTSIKANLAEKQKWKQVSKYIKEINK